MNRQEMLAKIQDTAAIWDIVIIGGGATGLGSAIDAASRGYQVLLVEQADFAQATSSRSTKLVHGGVRYLQQGNLSLVLEALKERGLLRQNAPHLVHNIPFVVPNYDWWEGPFYGVGLKLYDMLAGTHGFGPSKLLSREKTLQSIPTVEPKGLLGGVSYHDGQFDDARLAINMAQTAAEWGGALINYMQAIGFTRSGGVLDGILARDVETSIEYRIKAKAVVNATGVFSDSIRRMDDPQAKPIIRPSQGVHLVLDKSFLPGESAILVPHTDDGRVLFAVPWRDRVVVGTTETPMEETPLEPRPLPQELDFLLTHAARYLSKDPSPADVLSAFAGLRPLVSPGHEKSTAAISRDHTLHISRSGLITITGGKWTTYRRMAQDTIDQAAILAQLEERPCITADLHIHGYHEDAEAFDDLAAYGSDAPAIREIFNEDPKNAEQLHANASVRAGEVIWAVRREMARTVEDFLSRRTRSLLLDARISMEMAPGVAAIIASELGRNAAWERQQVQAFRGLAEGYLFA